MTLKENRVQLSPVRQEQQNRKGLGAGEGEVTESWMPPTDSLPVSSFNIERMTA